jgi:predicted peptidase
LLVLPAIGCRSIDQDSTPYLHHRIRAGDLSIRVAVYLPRNWSAKKRWPVILHLHGSGQRGDDGMRQTRRFAGIPSGFRASS